MAYAEINFKELVFSVREIAEIMGYGVDIPDRMVSETVERLLAAAADKVVPSCYYDIVDARILDKSICTGGIEFESGKIISKLMRGAEKIVLFLASAGLNYDRWVDELKEEGDYLDVFVADSIGTGIAEKAGDYMERLLEKEIGELKHTNRFSPGYCGWNVVEQKKLFSLFPPGICGVTLRESCLMTPIKSISGILGIGKDVKAKVYGCNVCEMTQCYLRRDKRPSMMGI